MPCGDVTETIRLRLDGGDRLLDYRLSKRTCGRAVGEASLLAGALAGRGAAAILAIDVEDFAAEQAFGEDEVAVFLALKHLFALQAALRAATGLEPAGLHDACTVAVVAAEGEETIVEADISIDVVTERIKSCGNCKGCGALRKLAAKAPV
ncbi:MAG: hypothetical protein SF028_08370 [Candidatus Sumerlaeia bacterium]|nr:hypothetical protein [Candidatus Sumerlaeia bacterium]